MRRNGSLMCLRCEGNSNNFAGGYLSTDLNGDGIVDGLDFIYWEQNSNNFVGAVVH